MFMSIGTVLTALPLGAVMKEEESTENDYKATDGVIFVGMSLILGIGCRHLLRGTRVPYTVALLVIGIGLGSLEYGTSHHLGKIGNGIRIWAEIDPDLLLAVFLPALLFESSFSMEIHQIKRCMAQMIILAGPGVLFSTFCLGSAIKLVFPYNWSWKISLLLGGLLSATDPVAVVALLKELGASKKLSTIIEGESLMNDGTAIVVYQLFLRMVLGSHFSWGAIVKFLMRVSLGAVGMGIAFGIVSVLWLGFIFNDTVIEITLTLAVSYVAYFTAQEGADISGVLTVMTLGMFYSAFARTAFKGESQESLHNFWGMVAYIANTLIFILSGVVIAEGVLSSDDIFKHHEYPWGYLALLYIFVQVARIIVVGALFPSLKYFGYGMNWKEATVLVWAGLRGAVALSLSLSVKQKSDSSSFISSDTGTMFLFFTGGIVFLTLIINGSTTQLVLHVLKMDMLSQSQKRILNFTKHEMLSTALKAFGDLGDDEELGPADWPTVKRYITSLNEVTGDRDHSDAAAENDDNLDHKNLKDIRVRFLNGVQAAYWGMLEEGRITQNITSLLMQSVEEGLDLVSLDERLCDWKPLQNYVTLPSYYKFLQTSVVPKKLVTYFVVERLETGCYICAAFLRAHRIARQQLQEFIGESGIASMIIKESEEEGEEPRKFLEEVRVSFPQVLRVLKTRQVTFAVLNRMIDYVHDLEKIGLLEEKETTHLHDSVQTDLKKLLRNPPVVKIPKVRDIISSNPFLGALPSPVREPILVSTKEQIKLRGSMLYKEGSKPTGIWLISNGVVKWDSKNLGKHLLHPTFSHGSTLGLYEVLVGKQYMCNIVTDSVVLCFFIESEKILEAFVSDSAVEDFFWKESVIVLAKLLLPQVFDKMAMQDLRALVAERSTMNVYLRGETFELPQFSVGILLEGFVKLQGAHEELLHSPAALLPNHGDQSFQRLETSGSRTTSFSHQVLSYHVETRARVILFDIAGFEANRTLQRRSSSLLPIDRHSGPLTRERSLMSWPEHVSEQQQSNSVLDESDQRGHNLSARAMQLSIFGSMINTGQWRPRSFSHGIKPNSSKSQSFPRLLSNSPQGIVSVRSEGSSTMRKKFEVQQRRRSDLLPQLEDLDQKKNHERADSSDESGGEDEHIVRIDSPSRLSFQQAS